MTPHPAPDSVEPHQAPIEAGSRRFQEFAQAMRASRERVEFEALLADLSAAFVRVPAEQVDAQIEESLRQVLEFLDVDRGSLGECLEDGRQLHITHSCVRAGIPPLPPSILNHQLPWYVARILQGEVLRFSRLPDDLPPEAVHEREYVVHIGMKSHVMIPFKVGGSLLGAMGFASFRNYRAWPDELVQRLRLMGEVFANALARKRADLALRENEARHRLLLESTHAIPWIADVASGRFAYVGPQAGKLLGYPADDWYAESFWTDHLHPDDRAWVPAFCRDQAQRSTAYEFDYRMVAADGRTVWLHDVVSVLRQDGTPALLWGFLIDITARKAAEEEALRLRDRLARAARVTTMGELAAAIAHEINQPLCAIVSNAQAAQRFLTASVPDPAEVSETLLDIVNDGQRASEVIGRIRTLLQKGQPARARFDLNDAIREVAALMRHQLTRKGIVLSFDLAADLSPVLGDKVQLQQVVLNLMVNGVDALDHAETGARELSLRSACEGGGTTVVSVRDSGPGIAAEHLEQIFDALFTTKPDGMGIGLAISRSIVEAHGGRIWADANAAGATFHFSLPITVEATP